MTYKNNTKAKRYYWLQLKTDFFEQKEIKLLRKIAGGDTFTIIYLKMLLASLKDNGKLYFEAIGNDFVEEVALMVDEDVENVSLTINFLQNKGLLEIVEDDEYFLSKVPEMVGSESYSAERMRRFRSQEKQKVLQSDGQASQCDSHVTKRRDRDREELEKSRGRATVEDRGEPAPAESKNVYQIFQECFGMLNSINQQDLSFWIEDLSEELVIEAMKKAVLNGKPYSYAKGIMKQWSNKGIKTVEDAKSEEVQFNNNHFKNKPVRKEVLPKWAEESTEYPKKKMMTPEEIEEWIYSDDD